MVEECQDATHGSERWGLQEMSSPTGFYRQSLSSKSIQSIADTHFSYPSFWGQETAIALSGCWERNLGLVMDSLVNLWVGAGAGVSKRTNLSNRHS